MIKSEEELLNIIKEFESKTPKSSKLLFRGQTQKYDEVRSGRARPDSFINEEVENGWNTLIGRLIDNKSKSDRYKQSILQHYGFPTFYIDLTSNPLTAAWFACNKWEKLQPMIWIGDTFREHNQTTYSPINEGIGHFIIFEFPDFGDMINNDEIFDISNESNFLRPKKQSGYLMLDQRPRLPNPNNYIQTILELDRTAFKCSQSISDLFPHPNDDEGYSKILDVPFIQLPSYYFRDELKSEESLEANIDNADELTHLDKYFVKGKRAIDIPFYIKDQNDLLNFNPKWKDITIFEPSPFRLWKTLEFDLGRAFKGQVGNFADTAKVTITPHARGIIENYAEPIDLEWLSLKTNNIFFSYAVEHHDKVITHKPPYLGKWLHKDNDLILELQLIADDDEHIEVQRGYGYIKDGNKLTYTKIENECDSGTPEKHLPFITSFLKIHNLIKKGKVALVQHPHGIENWYILL